MQFDKLLAPIDFSPSSQKVLDYALALARRFGAGLTLLQVIEPSPLLTLAFPEEAVESENAKHKAAEMTLSALLDSVDRDGIDIDTVVLSGGVEDQILSEINHSRASLLIIGNHHRAFVLHKVPIPALTVADTSKSPAFDRILLATDLSKGSREGMHHVLKFAQMSGARLAAVHAVEVGVEGGAEAAEYLTDSRTREAHRKFKEFQTEAARHHTELETIVVEGRAEAVILNTAENSATDFIVITTGAVPGLVADDVIRDGRVPVLTIPVREKAELKWADDRPAA